MAPFLPCHFPPPGLSFITFNTAGVRTEAALCRGLESAFSRRGGEAPGEDMPWLAVQQAVPKDTGCLPVCQTFQLLIREPRSVLVKAALHVWTCSGSSTAQICAAGLDRGHADAAFPRPRGREPERPLALALLQTE